MSRVTHAGLTDVGRVRQENEDRWFADPARGLYLVADGMGGSRAGGVAAQVVVEVLPRLLCSRLQPTDDLRDPDKKEDIVAAIAELSDRLKNESGNHFGSAGIGSTVVLLVVHQLQALVVHLGDSRAYLFNDQRIEQLTRDHSLVQILIDSGEISTQHALRHPARGQLTRYVGMPREPLPEARLVSLSDGDRLLLCSDGLSGMLEKEQIAEVIRSESDLSVACARLVSAANDCGGSDNITALVVAVSEDGDTS